MRVVVCLVKVKHAKPVAVIIAAAIFGVIITLLYAQTNDALQYARYSLGVTVLVAITLGGYFWLLQKQDYEKMQEVLHASEERERKRKQFWANVAYSHLLVIVNSHSEAREV